MLQDWKPLLFYLCCTSLLLLAWGEPWNQNLPDISRWLYVKFKLQPSLNLNSLKGFEFFCLALLS